MAHLNLSRSVTIKKAASGVTEGVGRMGKCFIKDVSYQRPDIGRTFFLFMTMFFKYLCGCGV